ncbi:hypothetical protein N8787_02930 [Opitutaceae bacterium]|nr:hypothetical protein [Opitutaceae bacterium]
MDVIDFGEAVDPGQIRQDKIELGIGDWDMRADTDTLMLIYSRLASRPGRDAIPIPENELGWIFNRFGSLPTPTKGVIRSRDTQSVAAPIFGGKMIIRDLTDPDDLYASRMLTRMNVYLTLNAVRFLIYQTLPENFDDDPSNFNLGDPNIRKSGKYADVEGNRRRSFEISLDGNDNWIAHEEWETFSRGEAWQFHLRRYIVAVSEAFQSEFERSTEGQNAQISPEGNGLSYQLDVVENFVDFLTPNDCETAIAFVDRLEPFIRMYRKTECDRYDGERDSAGVMGHSKSLRLRLTRGIELKIYAKTNRRVRFEVAYRLKDCGRLLHPDDRRSIRRRTESMDELMTWFDNLAQDTSERLNSLFTFLNSRMSPTVDQLPAHLLPARISGTLGDRRLTDTILSLLLSAGSISLSPGRDRLRNSVRKLEENGILERAEADGNRCRTFTVAPRWTRALHYLQAETPPPTIRERNRDRTRRNRS